ncbi:MAG TPA: EthD family reductase [Bacteroidota bacterium]|nr:EthD family reductase [Bacteroidota bacterium]
MVKLIALYKTPENKAEFDKHYAEVHTPLVKKMPGLRKLEVAKITGAPIGEPKHYLLAEMYFDNQDALNASMASAEGKAAARDLMSFAGNLVSMFYAEVTTNG